MSRLAASPDGVLAHPHRFRLSRAGVLNVWQYDDQVFDFADGRMLLRGANGAGKSKTLEMLLPFVLDGDKLRMTASGRHHTSLLWLMTDGYEGQGRTGYVWVEFTRTTDDGDVEWFTCGVGVRASQSARNVTSWYFTSPRRVGHDLPLEDDAGPLSRERCRSAIGDDGHFFDGPRQYKQHVGETLFGLAGGRYDELLRLLYWLRQPQVGEDIEPGRLAEILSIALPELDDAAVRSAGGTLDELAAFGEQLARRRQAAEVIGAFAQLYGGYARGAVVARGDSLVQAHRELARSSRDVGRRTAEVAELAEQTTANHAEQEEVATAREGAEQRLAELEASPEARSHQRVLDLGQRAGELARRAEIAGRHAAAARTRADDSRQRVDRDAESWCGDVRGLATNGQSVGSDGARLRLGAPLAVPSVLVDPVLPDRDEPLLPDPDEPPPDRDDPPPDRDDPLDAALAEHAEVLEAARPLVGELQAAVQVVDESRRSAEHADAGRRAAEREAAKAEAEADTERGRLADAERAARVEEEAFRTALAAWRADERAVSLEPPDELSAESVVRVGPLAREAAGPQLERLSAVEAEAGSRRVAAERSLSELHERRATIEAERDPAPPAPPLGRSERADSDGAPLWRLVEFADGLDAAQRAGLEAALESSGLLDAWVRVDGRVLDAERRDVVLPSGAPVPGRSLADLLVVAPPDGCPVTAVTMGAVLARVSVERAGDAEAVVGMDGRWRLGPLTGLAAKPAAQYVGASARVAERARQLADVDAQIAAAEDARREASVAGQSARDRRTAIGAWLDDVPAYGALLRAWAVVESQAAAAVRADETARAGESAAEQARAVAAAAHQELDELAARHGLPTSEDGLAARREQLRALDAALAQQVETASRLRARLTRWREDISAWAGLERQATELEAEAVDIGRQAQVAAQRHAELRQAVEASVRELEERLAATRAEIAAARARESTLRREQTELSERHGAAKRDLAHAADRHGALEPVVVTAAHAVAALADVPGLLASAGASAASGAFELARGVAAGAKIPPAVIELARSLAGLELPERPVTEAAVWNRYTDATSGPAADCEPRVLEHPGVLAVVARDETGEYPLAELAGRLAAQVARDAELLTERERRLFEEHILGELGESLRESRLEAEELVSAMNRLLAGITTSQGVRVTLHWRLRDEIPDDARQAVALLGRPLGALLPDERTSLRDAMHRLIEASRAEEPELSYTEHLSRALDYRQWFAFRVRYTRPEIDGRWLDLHRKSPLSQGEQKVVCYLPLFAAAAAHFSSVAGAAPYAPRFVLLDDAFPKIDVRTHPLLFRLLVDLDLDFLITSERLWGDHPTVPSLAIYEALRDPSERGIAQYEHRWDGQRLHTVGA
jgi:uncharacterized protein (TIGR02680 family)